MMELHILFETRYYFLSLKLDVLKRESLLADFLFLPPSSSAPISSSQFLIPQGSKLILCNTQGKQVYIYSGRDKSLKRYF